MLPVSVYFFIELLKGQKAEMTDYLLGLPLGITFTLVTSVEVINWIKSRRSHIFMPKHS
jgi:hypothetical protein